MDERRAGIDRRKSEEEEGTMDLALPERRVIYEDEITVEEELEVAKDVIRQHCCPINMKQKRLKSRYVGTMDVPPNTVKTGGFKPWHIIIRYSLNC